MSRFKLNRPAAQFALLAFVIVAIAPTVVFAQPPHALVPIRTPNFSIDLLSPTINIPTLTAGDVLNKPGPTPVIPRVGLGLNSVLDDLDALSGDRSDILPNAGSSPTFAILFSVDRQSTGLTPPDPALVAINRPFNAFDQAQKGQAPADLFMSTLPFDMSGPIYPPLRGVGTGNNTSTKNQGDTGGVDYDLKPNKNSDVPSEATEAKDDIDAMAYLEPDSPMLGVEAGGIFFSLSRQSPSLSELPGNPSGANIYFDFSPTSPNNEILYAGASQLGLVGGPNGDDIEGMLVADNGDRILTPADRIFFTLSRGSPSLGTTFSAADILVSNGNGNFFLYSSAIDLGLATTDAIDGLEVLVTNDIDQSIVDHALLRVIPGDHDGDGDLDQDDCDGFKDCYSGSAPFDINGTTNYTVAVGPGNQFNPSDITIETGDRVTWIWAGGNHNVVSGTNGVFDGAFFSGSPTSVTGTMFNVQFTDAFVDLHTSPQGIYNYFSQTVPTPGMVGKVTVVSNPCATYDIDLDGDVDCEDARLFKSVYLQFNATICLPLTIDEFVAVLLDQPLHPMHVCLADMNGDGLANGRDVRHYVNAYLAAP